MRKKTDLKDKMWCRYNEEHYPQNLFLMQAGPFITMM